MMDLIIPMAPVAKKTWRWDGRRAYYPQAALRDDFRWLVKSQLPAGWQPIPDIPIQLFCHFVFQRPKSHFIANNPEKPLKKKAPYYHIQKPDIDNLFKFIKDGLTGLIWEDDRQVYRIEGIKRWARANESPSIKIIVLAVDEMALAKAA